MWKTQQFIENLIDRVKDLSKTGLPFASSSIKLKAVWQKQERSIAGKE
jgi:hypothetical protein